MQDSLRQHRCCQVICLGTPRLHEKLNRTALQRRLEGSAAEVSGTETRSLLLDLDIRFRQFNYPGDYARFNMFTRHFFSSSEKQACWERLKLAQGLVIDPPFGAPLAALANTLNWLRALIPSIKVFLYFPYFSRVRFVRLKGFTGVVVQLRVAVNGGVFSSRLLFRSTSHG